MEQNSNNIPELQSPFGQLKEVDADGKEWWDSRKLSRVMGYGKYSLTIPCHRHPPLSTARKEIGVRGCC